MSAAASSSAAAPLPSIYALSPPHGAITDDDHGGYVVIATWILMCFFTICVLTRLLTRFIPVTVGGIDDVLSGISMLFAIAQSATVHVSASNGLGQHQKTLSSGSFAIYAKSYYAANILFLVAIYFAKISLVFLIVRLSPARSVHRVCYAVLLAISIWIVAEILAYAFQCNLPQPWNYQETCSVNISALYYTIAAGDILTDLAVIILPAYVIWGVQIPARKRWAVIAIFASRLAVVVCSAIRIATLPSYLSSDDRSWNAVTPQTWIQVIQCLSIITACTPCLKPFLESLESGFMDISMKGINGTTYGAGHSNQSGGGGSRRRNRNGNTNQQRSGTDSYMMTSITSQHGKSATNTNVEAKDASLIDGGRYLDLDNSRERAGSLPESERVLTSKSSDDDFHLKDEGIRVTREVEIRDEQMSNGHGEGRRGW